ncbi:MAG: class I SAM-dependent methyltransferase [Deltaproteobacteria bacterium]|nr:class I SAM-dependent methyltransferase [Deltaproteobacteria bacterium]
MWIPPDKYDAWYQTHLGSLCDKLEKDAIFSLFKPKGLVLDIGCGTGNYTYEVQKRGGKAVGMDTDFDMVLFAKNKATIKGVKPLFIVGNAQALPFKDNLFDGILEVTALCFIRHPETVIKEAHRVLKSDGTIVIGELNRLSYWAFLRRAKGWFKETVYKHARFFSISTLTEMLHETGFKDLQRSSCLHFPPIDSKWFLKIYKIFEKAGRTVFPKDGAFLVITGRK